MIFPNLAVGIFILSNKKIGVDLDINTNRELKTSKYSEKSSFSTFTTVRTNLQDIRNQFINMDKKYGNSTPNEWLKIEDLSVAEIILKAFADDDKKKILNATLNKTRTFPEILDVCKIPSTSGYRRIKSLIRDGLLIPNGSLFNRNRKRVRRYVAALENIQIDIDKGKLVVKVRFTKIKSY